MDTLMNEIDRVARAVKEDYREGAAGMGGLIHLVRNTFAHLCLQHDTNFAPLPRLMDSAASSWAAGHQVSPDDITNALLTRGPAQNPVAYLASVPT